MKEEQGVSFAERPQEVSKTKRYLRYIVIAFFLIFFAAVIIGAIVRKFGA